MHKTYRHRTLAYRQDLCQCSKMGLRSIRFVGEAAALIHAQQQQRRFPFLEDQQGKNDSRMN